ncbi:MAG: hypothetical protein ACKVYV_07690 [Limisphaerales bacterium]
MTVNHAWTRARLRDAKQAGFRISRIILVDTPRSFPQSGFQLGLIVYSRGFAGDIALTELPETW